MSNSLISQCAELLRKYAAAAPPVPVEEEAIKGDIKPPTEEEAIKEPPVLPGMARSSPVVPAMPARGAGGLTTVGKPALNSPLASVNKPALPPAVQSGGITSHPLFWPLVLGGGLGLGGLAGLYMGRRKRKRRGEEEKEAAARILASRLGYLVGASQQYSRRR